MNTFEQVLQHPAAALILADKLSGRIISRIADGFGEDPALGDMMNLYRVIELRAIREEWHTPVLSLREMFDIQIKDASQDTVASQEALDGLTKEQREIWESEPTRSETRVHRLQKALPQIVDLYRAATPDEDSWDDLEVINQWSLLNATERGLHNRRIRYKQWAKEDTDRGKTDTNATRWDKALEEATEPLFDIITEFLDGEYVTQALEQDVSNGIRVPQRRIA